MTHLTPLRPFPLTKPALPAQMVFYLARRAGTLAVLSPVQQLALYVAALCHDLEHPVPLFDRSQIRDRPRSNSCSSVFDHKET
jgi:hypothetical protein